MLLIPRVPPNYANWRLHRMRAAAHAKRDRLTAALAVQCDPQRRTWQEAPALRIELTLRCHSAQRMDLDNLARRLKHVRDGIADALGLDDDRDSERLAWTYAGEHERRTLRQGVAVRVHCLPAPVTGPRSLEPPPRARETGAASS